MYKPKYKMGYVLSSIVFSYFYLMYYLFPGVIIAYFIKKIGINSSNYLGIFGIILLLLAVFRSKLARQSYLENEDYKFWDAHSASWSEIKMYLSFLPIIGRFFNKDKRE